MNIDQLKYDPRIKDRWDCFVSDTHKAVYLNIPKNASTSFERTLPLDGFVEYCVMSHNKLPPERRIHFYDFVKFKPEISTYLMRKGIYYGI